MKFLLSQSILSSLLITFSPLGWLSFPSIAATSSCGDISASTTPIATDILIKGLQWTHKSSLTTNLLKNKNNRFHADKSTSTPHFVVLGGGSTPDSTEIALEKNILYFQRTLKELGYHPQDASIFFANGNDGKASIRYIDESGKQQFKVPQIPYLMGESSFENLQAWMQRNTQQSDSKPVFMYFTGHGIPNKNDLNNNSITLWNRKLMSVQQFSQMLDKLPHQKPIAVVMVQCYSGSFANFIYEGGNSQRPVALQTRCGFFATVKTLPSVGCTPLVNEADYRDYSSSFFAGLSGRNRMGKKVASADYNLDGRISYREAHAFTKVDAYTMDLPISTSEAWLQEQASSSQATQILAQPINTVMKTARPEQRYVVNQIVKMFQLNPNKPYQVNMDGLPASQLQEIEKKAYMGRLGMELINVGMEKEIRTSQDDVKLSILEKLLKCESGSP